MSSQIFAATTPGAQFSVDIRPDEGGLRLNVHRWPGDDDPGRGGGGGDRCLQRGAERRPDLNRAVRPRRLCRGDGARRGVRAVSYTHLTLPTSDLV